MVLRYQGSFLFDGQKPQLCAVTCAVLRRIIFCNPLMLLAPGIFPKFWSIPPLISHSVLTINGTVSVLIPHILVVSISRSLYFESFSMTFIKGFRSDGTDTSISLQHRLVWSLITISGLFEFADSSLIRMYLRIPENCDNWACVHTT